jgi:hypothetical protein
MSNKTELYLGGHKYDGKGYLHSISDVPEFPATKCTEQVQLSGNASRLYSGGSRF